MTIYKSRIFNKSTLIIGISLSVFLYSKNGYPVKNVSSDSFEIEMINEPNETPSSFDENIIQDYIVTQSQRLQSPGNSGNIPKSINPESIINLGKIFWEIIKAGQPVVNISTDSANALPEGILNWQSMSGWKTPIAKPYKFSWKLFGEKVVTFDYSVVYTYGGNINGVGQYLTNVVIIPTNVKVFWGYKFAADVSVTKVTNIGTKENPEGALQMILKWKIDSMVAHHENSSTFYITGSGGFGQITLPPNRSLDY